MSRKDISRYFTRSFWSRMPLYKAVLALSCAMILVVGTGAGIAISAVNAAANSSSISSSAPGATATPDPTASPTPEPTATPEPIQLGLEVTAVQQTLGITVTEAESGMPVVGTEFEVVVDYKEDKSASSKSTSGKDSSSKSSSSTKTQKPTETYKIDPKTGTLLIEELPVGEYTVHLSEIEGYILPEPVTTKVKEKVEYKVDTDAVKDQIKDESEVGAGDIVTDDNVLNDETTDGFDPTVTLPANDYDSNISKKEEVKASVYTVAGNTQSADGKAWLLNADGSRSNYYVSKTDKDVNGGEYIVEATYVAPVSVNSVFSSVLGGFGRLFFPVAFAEDEVVSSGSESSSTDSGSTSTSTSGSDSTSGSTSTSGSDSTSGSTSTSGSDSTSGSTSNSGSDSTSGSTSTSGSDSTSGSTSNSGSGSSSGSTSNSGSGSSGSGSTSQPDPMPATVVLFKDGKAVANSDFKLTATEVTVKVVYSGWQPSFDSKEAFYDPNTHEKLVNTEKVIAGVKYKFDANGKPTVVSSSNGLVKGIDVSKYQYNIDWNAVKASGIDFAIIRVGYRGYGTGALVEDPYFRQNIKGANAAGVKVGLYFYSQAINEAEAVEEASMVIRLIQETGGRVSYPIYFDTEKVANDTGRADSISRDQRTRNAVAFCNAIQNAGYRAGVYSYASWFYNNLNMASLTGYSIWIAQYRDQLDFKYNYDIWQYTSSGVVPGISTRVDMNVSKLG